jgi:hypothetical protein
MAFWSRSPKVLRTKKALHNSLQEGHSKRKYLIISIVFIVLLIGSYFKVPFDKIVIMLVILGLVAYCVWQVYLKENEKKY